jgi:transcription antitermination protein NusB
MGQRRKSRELVLQLLFQREHQKTISHAQLLSDFWKDFPTVEDVQKRVESIYFGVWKELETLDERIQKASSHWKLSRMSQVDRNVLRLATYELLFCDDVPREVVLDEAIEIAKRFGSEESAPFVNGILDHIELKKAQ